MAIILVVEDDRDLAWTMEQLLRIDGHDIQVAYNGEEAISRMVLKHPDLVITDFELPILNGEGMVLRMFIEDCGKEHIPIIIISSFPDLESIAKRIGTSYFLPKPYVIEEVLALINRALAERASPQNPKLVAA